MYFTSDWSELTKYRTSHITGLHVHVLHHAKGWSAFSVNRLWRTALVFTTTNMTAGRSSELLAYDNQLTTCLGFFMQLRIHVAQTANKALGVRFLVGNAVYI